MNWASNRKDVQVSLKLLNKGLTEAEGVRIELFHTKEHVKVIEKEAKIEKIAVNEIMDIPEPFTFHVASKGIEIARFLVKISDKNGNEWTEYLDVKLRDEQPIIGDFVIADGKEYTVSKAGIDSVKLFLGMGNGDGIANPGETIVLLAKERGKLWRTELITADPYIDPFGVKLRTSDNWGAYDYVNGSAKISRPVIASNCPEHHKIEFYGEYWLPDNRDHIITRKRINIEVSGSDQTPPALRWVNISADNTIQARIYDGTQIQNVIARFIPVDNVSGLDYVNLQDPKRELEITLHDDGINGDRKPGDFVFSHKIPANATYFYRVKIESTDLFGNTNKEIYPEVFIIN